MFARLVVHAPYSTRLIPRVIKTAILPWDRGHHDAPVLALPPDQASWPAGQHIRSGRPGSPGWLQQAEAELSRQSVRATSACMTCMLLVFWNVEIV